MASPSRWWAPPRPRHEPQPSHRRATMKHEILGEITRPEGDPSDGVAIIQYGARELKIRISRDDRSFEAVVALASELVTRLGEFDQTARKIATVGLRKTYNDGWNEYDEVQEDGSLKTISN